MNTALKIASRYFGGVMALVAVQAFMFGYPNQWRLPWIVGGVVLCAAGEWLATRPQTHRRKESAHGVRATRHQLA